LIFLGQGLCPELKVPHAWLGLEGSELDESPGKKDFGIGSGKEFFGKPFHCEGFAPSLDSNSIR
jgi:hypothetical protein